ncbi:hypothetical protein PMAYCL1PPCAC_21770, partial [Pristionchus mayeri]
MLLIRFPAMEFIKCHQGYQGVLYTGPTECTGDACLIDVEPTLIGENSQSCITNLHMDAGCWSDGETNSEKRMKGCTCK